MSAGTERRVNIADPDFRHFPEFPDGFRPGIVRLGALMGATNTGISVYELPPGQAIAPYHYENPEDEWLLVLEVDRPGATQAARTSSRSWTSCSSHRGQTAHTWCATTPTRPHEC